MDEETWLTAKEAKKLGLIDNITENSRVAAATTSTILGGDKFMARYRNEDPQQPGQPKESSEITVEDVMDKLEEILAEVKKQTIKIQVNLKNKRKVNLQKIVLHVYLI